MKYNHTFRTLFVVGYLFFFLLYILNWEGEKKQCSKSFTVRTFTERSFLVDYGRTNAFVESTFSTPFYRTLSYTNVSTYLYIAYGYSWSE